MRFNVHFKEVTGSTNDDARKGMHGDVFYSSVQTAGRGRIGHKWLSAPGDALTFSAVLSVEGIPPDVAMTFPLVAGLAVRRVTSGGIKWPNDVLVGGRKVAGILCERNGDCIICGIGVNVNQLGFPQEIEACATSLALLDGRRREVADVLDAILAELGSLYDEWFRGGFAAVYPEIVRNDLLLGRRVSIMQTDLDSDPVEGICEGVMPDGTLSVSGKRVYAGEAHLLFPPVS